MLSEEPAMNFQDIVKAHEAANERGSVNALVAHKHRGELIELVREMKPYVKYFSILYLPYPGLRG